MARSDSRSSRSRTPRKLVEAAELLTALGLPKRQTNERSALTLLALAGLRPRSTWTSSQSILLRTVDVMEFIREHHGRDYAANSRETFRRQTLHQFEQARIVDRNPDDPGRPTNSGNNCYALTPAVLPVLHAFGTPEFEAAVQRFVAQHGTLHGAYSHEREIARVPILLPDGSAVALSAGAHNVLQKRVIEEFGPRFAPGATLLYLGDTAKKHVVLAEGALLTLGITITEHDKLPDLVLHDPSKNWLYLVEAVTSHGPVSETRRAQFSTLLKGCAASPVFVSAFLSRADFKKYASEIAWETEVWIAENPDHLIHFNGDKFLGPYGA